MHYSAFLKSLGIILNEQSGQLYYANDYQPISYHFELIFIRHGETYGNCGQSTANGTLDHRLISMNIKDGSKRIFQGDVDSDINQLTDKGKQQSLQLAITLKTQLLDKGWVPDLIFYSPLTRAKETGLPFINQNNLEKKYIVHEGIKELSFGEWDNRRICDMDPSYPCHKFYLEQNALIKQAGVNGNGVYQSAENFCDVLVRAHSVLQEFEAKHSEKKLLLFSHSMFGAACCVLTGLAQQVENQPHLAFDGKRKNGTSYTIPHVSPFNLIGKNNINGQIK